MKVKDGGFAEVQPKRPVQNISTTDCRDDEAAKKEASGMFTDVARDIAEELQSKPEWQIEVANEAGKLIFRISVAAEAPD